MIERVKRRKIVEPEKPRLILPDSLRKLERTMSKAEILATLPADERADLLRELTPEQQVELLYDWDFWGRPKQFAPEGDWLTWVLLAGRGFGKTRTGAAWFHKRAMEFPGRWMALIARTPADARDYQIEGPGGILRNTPLKERPDYEVSKRRITWPNGSYCTIYSDEEPEQCRGFSGDTAWADEVAKYAHPDETWDNLEFGMRECSSDMPRKLITTTPKPVPLVKRLVKEAEGNNSTVVVTRGTSYENRANLDPHWFDNTIVRFEGTRKGRQEIRAEILDDVPGALWTRTMIDNCKVSLADVPEIVRIVVGVDPSGTSGPAASKKKMKNTEDVDEEKAGNDVGIIAVGLGENGHCYVFKDTTCNRSPAGWARQVIETYDDPFPEREDIPGADRIVAEINFGGAMVEAVIQSAMTDKVPRPVRQVRASKGKHIRAEPVASLYEETPNKKCEVHHVGSFPDLEDEMCAMTADGYVGKESPNRLDALVWAITDLKLSRRTLDEGESSGSLPVVTGAEEAGAR